MLDLKNTSSSWTFGPFSCIVRCCVLALSRRDISSSRVWLRGQSTRSTDQLLWVSLDEWLMSCCSVQRRSINVWDIASGLLYRPTGPGRHASYSLLSVTHSTWYIGGATTTCTVMRLSVRLSTKADHWSRRKQSRIDRDIAQDVYAIFTNYVENQNQITHDLVIVTSGLESYGAWLTCNFSDYYGYSLHVNFCHHSNYLIAYFPKNFISSKRT